MGPVTSYPVVQLSNEEFERLCMTETRGIPRYFTVDKYSGAISIYPRIETNKQVFAIIVSLEDKDET